eukprot:TRINITY_DN11001_c0_g1_i1.p1 TRINITY_DN11001_c0_g1~~TRINITY_DN11001_c0_g1_i1.p1  ORF type:complete len:286 (-),score=50.02 TRINITY_DN11001_c0_g1_i1:1146-2003(-)
MSFCCLTCVGQSSVGIVEHWGRFSHLALPGLHVVNPFSGFWMAGRLSTRIQQLDIQCDTKTKDNVFVTLTCSVHYRIIRQNADDAYYELQNPREQIRAYVFDVIRASVPRILLDDVFEQKSDIARDVATELEKVMSAYGYTILETLIVDIEPDELVRRAMNEINAAQRMRLAACEKAEAEKHLLVKRAEAEAEAKYLSGVGIARQRQAIVDGLRDSVVAFSQNVSDASSKDIMDLVMLTQYYDTMKEIGAHSKSNAVFMPHGPAHVGDIAAQVRDGLLQGQVKLE